MFRALPAEDSEAKKAAASAMLKAVIDLRVVLVAPDVPHWLTQSDQYLRLYIEGRWSGFDLLNSLINLKSRIENHSWSFKDGAETAFDFDSHQSVREEMKMSVESDMKVLNAASSL